MNGSNTQPILTPGLTSLIVNPTWDEYFMRHVYLAATKSKDERTKIGAVLVRDRHIVSEGYNGLPMGVIDEIPERQQRPEKYFWFEHAERNAIFVCARFGTRTGDTTMYTQGIPCAECCRAAIQAGILEIVVHKQWQDYQYANPQTSLSQGKERCKQMLEEADVSVRVLDLTLDVKGVMDGKVLSV